MAIIQYMSRSAGSPVKVFEYPMDGKDFVLFQPSEVTLAVHRTFPVTFDLLVSAGVVVYLSGLYLALGRWKLLSGLL